jgi:hypothetical protein
MSPIGVGSLEFQLRLADIPARGARRMSTIFDLVSKEIERRTDLGRLEARGTVRLAVKEAGFSVDAITARELAVVLERIMPEALSSRGVIEAAAVCTTLAKLLRELGEVASARGQASPERVFERLASGSSRFQYFKKDSSDSR